jgi:ABC-2 type transport system ATP-binding protein
MSCISLEGLTKCYGRVTGIDSVSLRVEPGEIFGFLGPNGAGKTTCIRLILGLIRPDRGSIHLFGTSLEEDRWRFMERVGLLPGDVDWWPELTGAEVLAFFARLRPYRPPVLKAELLDRFRISDDLLRRKVTTYSRGERRKLGLVAAMQHDPDLLILDEPTSGLDPLLRRTFYRHCRALKRQSKTVFLSSHNLYETQQVCDRVGIVRQGRLVTVETLEDLKRRNLYKVEITFETLSALDRFRLEGAQDLERMDRTISFRFLGEPSRLIRALAGLPVEDLSISPPTLEDLFLQYFGPKEEDLPGGAC